MVARLCGNESVRFPRVCECISIGGLVVPPVAGGIVHQKIENERREHARNRALAGSRALRDLAVNTFL